MTIHQTQWYTKSDGGRVLCQLCPRECHLRAGDRGFCFVRKNVDGQMVLDTYGRSTGFCIDPIEKKPLNHFYPGTPVLSFGTAGCNLGCKFCQNWDISKSREVARLSDRALPEEIAVAAEQSGCKSVAFTYNDPVIWAEYAIDTAIACRQRGIKSVAVTAGYITSLARGDFFNQMDAANIDLKSFSEDFYFKLTGSHLQSVLDTIEFVCNETNCWVELTNLIIPDANDSASEIEAMCTWIRDHIGVNVPIHFTAFHPDFRMTDRGRTDASTLTMAYDIARRCGLNYVYVGNIHDSDRQSTSCHECGKSLIRRDWHQLGMYAMDGNCCGHCGTVIPGHFDPHPGNWGARRQRVQIKRLETGQSENGSSMSSPPVVAINEPKTAKDQPANRGARTMNQDSFGNQTTMLTEMTELSPEQQKTILRSASAMVAAAVNQADPKSQIASLGELKDLSMDGVFVTVKRGETLRGCCGRQGGVMKLGEALADAAARTSRDPRMAPLSPGELQYLDLSVSLLGPPRSIEVVGGEREQAVQVGRHGLRIQLGTKGGLLLPQVAVEQNWNGRQFLDAVCRKAGLPAGAWKNDDAQVMLFDGVHFGDAFQMEHSVLEHSDLEQSDLEHSVSAPAKTLLTPQELSLCRDWVQSNLVALQMGATPMYYAMGVSDLEVFGIVLCVSHPARGSQQWLQLSTKDSRPMQSSLYQMTEQAVRWLGQHAGSECQIELAILSDSSHHGSDRDHDLRGIDPATRAVVLTDGRRWAVRFDNQKQPEEILTATRQMESFRRNEFLYSMHCEATSDSIAVSIGPRAEPGLAARPPAVAGAFYPADDRGRELQIDGLIDGLSRCEKTSAFAVMVPHAGLKYSGQVAAQVWRRVEVPDRVLIIGPKHTANGVDWAIAPHSQWQTSLSSSIAGDIEMATELADRLTGMELDAAAHAREHAIEVQLPLMLRYCPEVKLAAIAMQGATMDEVKRLAKELAQWIAEQDEPPLLVVSSDMNHFAEDSENRRRDRLALDALATGDGEVLLDVCTNEDITMCGQIPAAVVLMVMRELGLDTAAEEVAYATSADFGGDPARVVGYSGVIWSGGKRE